MKNNLYYLALGSLIGAYITLGIVIHTKDHSKVLDSKLRFSVSVNSSEPTTRTTVSLSTMSESEVTTRLKQHREKKAELMNLLSGFTEHINKGLVPLGVIEEVRREIKVFIRNSRKFTKDLTDNIIGASYGGSLPIIDEVSGNEAAATEALFLIDETLQEPLRSTTKNNKH